MTGRTSRYKLGGERLAATLATFLALLVQQRTSQADGTTTPSPPPEAKTDVSTVKARVDDHKLHFDSALEAGDVAKAQHYLDDMNSDVNTATAKEESAPTATSSTPAATAPGGSPAASPDVAAAKGVLNDAKTKMASTETAIGCGGKSRYCLYGGALLASYSLTLGEGDRAGQTGHHIVSLVLPTAGFRFSWRQYVSFDLGVYSAIISPEFQANAIGSSGTGCAKKGGVFEDDLPCEGNALLRPYGAAVLGATINSGSSSLGVFMFGVTVGWARTAQDPNAFRFWGLMIGTGGVYMPVPLTKEPS